MPYTGHLAARILERAVKDMVEDPDWAHDFPNGRMELITFFHGPFYEYLCHFMGLNPSRFRATLGIPQPGEGCYCEWCMSDDDVMGLLMEMDERAQEESCVQRGHIHAVVWDGPRSVMGGRRPRLILPIAKRRGYAKEDGKVERKNPRATDPRSIWD